MIIDNRAGAGAMLGAQAAAAMPADGYNLLCTVKGAMAIGPHLYPNVKYNPLNDFKSITQVVVVPHILTANPKRRTTRSGKMVEYAKHDPRKIDYASSLPNVPTVTEFNAELDPNAVIGNSWHGVFALSGTSNNIANKLNVELVKIVKTEAIQ